MQSGKEGDVGLRIDVPRRSTRDDSILHFAVLIYHFTIDCLQILQVDQRTDYPIIYDLGGVARSRIELGDMDMSMDSIAAGSRTDCPIVSRVARLSCEPVLVEAPTVAVP